MTAGSRTAVLTLISLCTNRPRGFQVCRLVGEAQVRRRDCAVVLGAENLAERWEETSNLLFQTLADWDAELRKQGITSKELRP